MCTDEKAGTFEVSSGLFCIIIGIVYQPVQNTVIVILKRISVFLRHY